MKNITTAAKAVKLMDTYLQGALSEKQKWENTYIKKQIDKRNKGGIFTINDHIRGMVYSMLTSERGWYKFLEHTSIETGQIFTIDEIFLQYEPNALLKRIPISLSNEIRAKKLGNRRIEKQMYALITKNIKKLLDIENRFGQIDVFYKFYENEDKTLKTLIKEISTENKTNKFAELGESLAAEYLKNVGYDLAKPDRHICRILGSKYLGCSDKEIVPVYEAFDIVSAIAKELGRPVAEVDYILWSYCATGYGGVCSKDKANHEICVVKELCNHTKG